MASYALVRTCTLRQQRIRRSEFGAFVLIIDRGLTSNSFGSFNYQKANINGSTYEIECHESFGTASTVFTNGINTLEQCLGLCSAQNNQATGTIGCVGVSFNAVGFVCYTYPYSSFSTGMPQGLQTTTFNFRSARLLYSPGYPLINDPIYLLPNVSSQNYGICGTPGAYSNAYAQTHFNPQYTNGLYQGSYVYAFWIECGGNFWPPPDIGSNVNVTQLVAAINSDSTLNPTGPGLPIGMPQSADDCLRLCAISYTAVTALYGGASKYGQPGGYGFHTNAASNQCLSWTWSSSGQCDLYIRSNAATSMVSNGTVVAAGHWIGAGTNNPVGTDTGVGYKKREAIATGLPDFSLFGTKY
jgi:hypothetical protein